MPRLFVHVKQLSVGETLAALVADMAELHLPVHHLDVRLQVVVAGQPLPTLRTRVRLCIIMGFQMAPKDEKKPFMIIFTLSELHQLL
jgi:hypothetical protein